ncbi:MAG: hypothetical protein ABJA81_06220 [Nocardioidaceae bacterium]
MKQALALGVNLVLAVTGCGPDDSSKDGDPSKSDASAPPGPGRHGSLTFEQGGKRIEFTDTRIWCGRRISRQ